MKYPIVHVLWEDAWQNTGSRWTDKTEPEYSPLLFDHVGFLLHDSEQGIILVESIGEHQMGQTFQIPRGMVKEMTVLKDAD